MRLNNLSILSKLALAFSLTLAAAAIAGVVIHSAVVARDEAALHTDAASKQRIATLEASAAHLDMAQTSRGYLLTNGVERHKTLYEAAGKRFGEQMAAAMAPAETIAVLASSIEPLRKMQNASRHWRAEIGDKVLKLASDSWTRPEATELAMSPRQSEFQQKFREAQAEALQTLDGLAAQFDEEERESQRRILGALVIGGFAALLSSLASALLLSRNIARPLERLTGQIDTLAAGDVTVDFEGATRGDGIGQIARACDMFKAKLREQQRIEDEAAAQRRQHEADRAEHERVRAQEQAQLEDAVKAFADALGEVARGNLLARIDRDLQGPAEALRREFNDAIAKLRETVATVAASARAVESGSQAITASADEMARRTEQQAASLEETASALVEITASVRQTADGAEQARQFVVATTSDAEKGGQVVAQAIAAMSNIEKSSGQIGQIIGVIDEIAFQTNLLALNAGVEAARAGDAGRGFAVVASEVRALAQRSAEAAKEIKTLISSSSGQVTQGVKLVHETGAALNRIVKQVSDIRETVTQIAAGASEQATGLQEINKAVGLMDQGTQQNAAMVEEAAASSHSLAGEARRLTVQVGSFQIGAEALRAPANDAAETPARRAAPSPAAPAPPARKAANGGFVGEISAPADDWKEF